MRRGLRFLYDSMGVTGKLIIFNVVFFILTLLLGLFIPNFIDYIAMKPENIVQGKYLWTLVTSMFMHGSFAHLFFNMFSLYFVGRFLEKIIGKKRFFYFYIISGIIAGIFFSLLGGFFGGGSVFLGRLFGDPKISGVGASGAIFGLVGLLAVLVPRSRVYLIIGPLIGIVIEAVADSLISNSALSSLISFAVTVYVFVSIFAIFSFNPKTRKIALPVQMPFWLLPVVAIVPLMIIGLFVALPIGNTAHLGGLIAGLVYGYYLRVKYKKKVKLLDRYFR
jgi:membrane associated rhomboid family serine protease